MRINGIRVLGKNRNTLRLSLTGPDGRKFAGLRFGDAEEVLKLIDGAAGEGAVGALLRESYYGEGGRRFPAVLADLAYTPEFNTYRGITTLQLAVRDLRIHT